MNVFEKILSILQELHVPYELLQHHPVYTMQQAAEICKHAPDQGVKTLLIKAYTTKHQFDYWLVVWQGDDPIPLDEISIMLHVKKCKLAQPDEVMKSLGVEIGAVSPFGYDHKYPVIFDKRLLEQDRVFINAGKHDTTLSLSANDLFMMTSKFSTNCIQY